jgi:hypothetical protein
MLRSHMCASLPSLDGLWREHPAIQAKFVLRQEHVIMQKDRLSIPGGQTLAVLKWRYAGMDDDGRLRSP